jgi:hypothetical protein
MGEMLTETELNKGAMGIGKSVVQGNDRTPTLADIGISKNESSRAQKIAALPQETFEKVKRGEVPISAAIKNKLILHGADRESTRNYQDPASPIIENKIEREIDESDSETLIGLKRYWKEAKKKERKLFITWLKARKELE